MHLVLRSLVIVGPDHLNEVRRSIFSPYKRYAHVSQTYHIDRTIDNTALHAVDNVMHFTSNAYNLLIDLEVSRSPVINRVRAL